MSQSCLTIILAAGEGKRMASALPKVLHPVAGLPMVHHVLDCAQAAGSERRAVVVGNQAERVEASVLAHDPKASIHTQTERLGTAHAVLAARSAIEEGCDEIVILYGDVPLIRAETIAQARATLQNDADVVVLGFETENPTGYGRMVRADGQLIAIREEKDATHEERQIKFCNSGIMAMRGGSVLGLLESIQNHNVQGEYYLTDVVEIARSRGLDVQAINVPEEDTLGVNNREQLADVSGIWQRRKRAACMTSGVTMSAPETVMFHHDTQVAADATIEPYVVFAEGVTVESGATIRAFSHLEGAHVGANAVVGPYARLRPGTHLSAGAKIGNFVETKKTEVGEGAKINHLSYVGDAVVGARANIGAGTITCNYDGYNKHVTQIGEEAFIGSNTSLVAPVSVGKGANTAAGTVVTKDVPDAALAITRVDQNNVLGLAKKLRDRYAAKKAAARG